MAAFGVLLLIIWAVSVGAWFAVTKYFKSSDVDKIKARLLGTTRAKAKAKAEGGAGAEGQSVIQSTVTTKNKLAQMVVDKYRLAPKIETFLEQAGLKWAPARLVHLCWLSFLGATIAFWVLAPLPHWIGFILGLVAAMAPIGYVYVQRKSRLKRFEALFPETLEFIARSMRAGHAFSVSLEMIHREFQEPISGEFRRTFEEHNLGLPMDVALQKFATRVPSLDVHFFVSAVLLQKRTGGNLAEILDKLAYVIRERFKLRGRIKAVSAHGKMTASALSCIPIAVAVLMFYTNPDYVKFFFTDDVGNMMMGSAIGLQIIGYFIMKKIVNIEV
jgi:tight adherence protein B